MRKEEKVDRHLRVEKERDLISVEHFRFIFTRLI